MAFTARDNEDGTATVKTAGGTETFIIDESRTAPSGMEGHICVLDHPDNPDHPGTWWLREDVYHARQVNVGR